MKIIVLGTGKSPCRKRKLSEQDAIALVMKRWSIPKKGKNEKNYYYCRECDSFHTTSL